MSATGKRKSEQADIPHDSLMLSGIFFFSGLCMGLALYLVLGHPDDPTTIAKAAIGSAMGCLLFMVLLIDGGPPHA